MKSIDCLSLFPACCSVMDSSVWRDSNIYIYMYIYIYVYYSVLSYIYTYFEEYASVDFLYFNDLFLYLLLPPGTESSLGWHLLHFAWTRSVPSPAKIMCLSYRTHNTTKHADTSY